MKMEFKKVSRFADADFNLPVRKTKKSAGYDFEVAEDIVIPAFETLMYEWAMKEMLSLPELEENGMTKAEITEKLEQPHSLEEISKATKLYNLKPTLVSTGVKCYLKEGYYLELSVRSSTPLKYWLILANGVGIIDGDYVDNPDNEGEIFFQIINLSPFPIALKKGDIIGQGILKRYGVVDGDSADGARMGGLGSTTSAAAMAVDNIKELEKASCGEQSLFDACM